MSSLNIVIDVNGEPAGVPGEPRIFAYSKVVTPALVTLSLDDYTGVTAIYWEILSKPAGSTAVLSDPTANSPTFTPTATVTGSYRIQCQINGGISSGTNLLAYRTQRYGNRKIAAGETLEASDIWGWTEAINDSMESMEGIIPTGGDTVKVSAADTTANYLLSKLFAGSGVTLSTVNPGADELVKIDASGGISAPDATVYIDSVNGSDVTGDGQPGTPYQTLSYAVSEVGQPVDASGYQVNRVFILVKGTYSAAVVLPTYQLVTLVLEEASITGALSWDLDPTYLYGLDPNDYAPTLQILGRGQGSSIGAFTAKNNDPAGGSLPTKTAMLENLTLGGHIVNDETAHATVASGSLHLILSKCENAAVSSSPSLRLGGVMETTVAAAYNPIILSSRDSLLTDTKLCGEIEFFSAADSIFAGADPDVNPSSGAGSYQAAIGGSLVAETALGLVDIRWVASASVTLGQSASRTVEAITCDGRSLRALMIAGATYGSNWQNGDNADGKFRASDDAQGVYANTGSFIGALSSNTDTVQTCLNALGPLGNFSSVYDPATFTVALTPSLTGCLHNTGNSTAGKNDPHEITLPTPAPGLVYTVMRSPAMDTQAVMTVEVDAAGSETLRIEGRTQLPGSPIATATKIAVRGVISFVAVSTTAWMVRIESGSIYVDPTSETEVQMSEGPFVITAGGGTSEGRLITRAGDTNIANEGNEEEGQYGIALGFGAEHLSSRGLSTGFYGKQREFWWNAHVSGTRLDTSELDPGQSQSVWGAHWVGKSVNGATDTTGAHVGSDGIYLDENTVFIVKGKVAARAEDHENALKCWEYALVVHCNNSGTGSILSKTITTIAETAHMNEGTWVLDFAISSTSWQDQLSLQITGESGRDVYCVGSIESTELSIYNP